MHDYLTTEDLTEEEADALIARAVAEIQRRKLETVAVFFLEMHKPVSFIGSQAAIAFSPFIAPLVGPKAFSEYARLFAKREYVERLIDAIESAATSETSSSDKPDLKDAGENVQNTEV